MRTEDISDYNAGDEYTQAAAKSIQHNPGTRYACFSVIQFKDIKEYRGNKSDKGG
jgi:hypothetical protein